MKVAGDHGLHVLQVGGLRLGPLLELLCIRDEHQHDDEHGYMQQRLSLYLKDSSKRACELGGKPVGHNVPMHPLANIEFGEFEDASVNIAYLLRASVALNLPVHNLHPADMLVYVS